MEHRVKPVPHYLFSNFKVSVTQFKASFINARVAPIAEKTIPAPHFIISALNSLLDKPISALNSLLNNAISVVTSRTGYSSSKWL